MLGGSSKQIEIAAPPTARLMVPVKESAISSPKNNFRQTIDGGQHS